MALMKFRALENPKERTSLILLFIPTSAPLDGRSLVAARMPTVCASKVIEGFQLERFISRAWKRDQHARQR